MRLWRAFFVLIVVLTARGAGAQPPLPAGWPDRLELGMASPPGDAAGMKATTSFGFRYQYLAGGVNTGNGWATWNTNGDFARYYIQDSLDNGIAPAFTYYMIYQSLPGVNQGGESDAVRINLQNTQTMTAFFNDVKLFFQKAGAFPGKTVVLHVEPDMWGYIQQQATRQDDAASFSVQVAAAGLSELSGLPNTAAGMAQGIVRLRDQYGPNVKLGYHASVWGTGQDILYADPSDAEVRALGTRAANFYKSLGANFDLIFAEFTDRDSGLRETWGDSNAWWRLADYQRNLLFLSTLSNAANRRLVLWQIPLGNTKMRACDNTNQHYQSNQVEFLLDDPARDSLRQYVSTANVVAFFFGRGDGQTTAASDAKGDGVTNPAALAARPALTMNSSPNNIVAQLQTSGAPQLTTVGGAPTLLSPWAADDDGGFFRWRARDYYAAGPLPLTEAPAGPAPAVGAVWVSTAHPTGFTVSWTTDQASDSQVEFGTSPALGRTSALSAALVTSHAVALTGLGANSPVYYRVRSKNAGGSAGVSDVRVYNNTPAFVAARGQDLYLDGRVYKALGVNRYNLVSRGGGIANGCGASFSDAELEAWFGEIEQLGATAVRFWLFQNNTSGGMDFARFDRLLELAAAHGVKVIPVLEDHWGGCSQSAEKDGAWYGGGYLAPYGSYAVSYKEYARRVVSRYKDNPTVLAWQLMNEAESKNAAGAADPQPLYDFARDMSAYVKSLDPNHLVSLGTIGGGQPGTAGTLYRRLHALGAIDVLEYHDYDPLLAAPPNLVARFADSDALKKPVLVGESGIKKTCVNPGDTDCYPLDQRAALFDAKLADFFGRAGDAYLLWSYRDRALTAGDIYAFDLTDPLAGVFSGHAGSPGFPDRLSPQSPRGLKRRP